MRPSQTRPIGANESQSQQMNFDIFSQLSAREEQELEDLRQREQLRVVQAKRKELERLRRAETGPYVPTSPLSSKQSSKRSSPGATPRQSRHTSPVGKRQGGLNSGGLIETPGPLRGIGGLQKEDGESKRRAKSLEERLRTRSGQIRGTWAPTASGRPSVENSPRGERQVRGIS